MKELAYMARDSQVQSKVEAKPNMASLPKLRWGAVRTDMGQRGEYISTHSDDLLDVERAHIAPVEGGAGPLGVQHREG